MATLSEFYETEARDCLAQMDRAIERSPEPDLAALHRAVRTLRGSAQMARDERMYRAAAAFEAAARGLAEHRARWSDDTAERARNTIADLRALHDQREAEADLDARVDAIARRWRDLGLDHIARAAAPDDIEAAAREFRAFAAREVAAIADALDLGVQQLASSSMDREPLKMILRRQRALLGATRLDEIPVVAEILRAVEDLTRVIAKLDVRVKQEWLDIYRVAREGLRSAVTPLERDENPVPTHALSRLRHMRQELIERYGAGETVSAAHQSEGLVQPRTASDAAAAAAAAEPPPLASAPSTDPGHETDEEQAAGTMEPEGPGFEMVPDDETDGGSMGVADPAARPGEPELLLTEEDMVVQEEAESDVVDIETLCYDADGALRRALELRGIIARAAAGDPAAREAADEVFDLIELALR